ncbi:MAG: hypothetical protein ACP6IP_10500 [Candidatus Njordarchaeia archaeon]
MDDAEKIARILTDLFGNGIKILILKLVLEDLTKTSIAKLAGVHTGVISKILERERIGDELSFRIFRGLAAKKPHILERAVELAVKIYEKELRNVMGMIAERDKKVREELLKKE